MHWENLLRQNWNIWMVKLTLLRFHLKSFQKTYLLQDCKISGLFTMKCIKGFQDLINKFYLIGTFKRCSMIHKSFWRSWSKICSKFRTLSFKSIIIWQMMVTDWETMGRRYMKKLWISETLWSLAIWNY